MSHHPKYSGTLKAFVERSRVTKVLELINLQLEKFPLDLVDENVEVINLSCNAIRDTHGLGDRFQQLKRIILKFNDLRSVCNEIGTIRQLESLALSHNNNLKTLPVSIANLENLKVLDISNCGFESIPNVIYMLKNLSSLSLANLNLKELPNELKRLEKLQVLNLSGISLGEMSLPTFYSLKCLYLRGCKLEHLPKGLSAKLESLDVSENELKTISVENLECLEELTGSDNVIGSLPSGILLLEKLKRLDLSHNKISEIPKELDILVKRGLEALDLTNNPIKTDLPSLVSLYFPMCASIPHRILPNLYLGGIDAAENKEYLLKHVRRILTIAHDIDPFYPDLFDYTIFPVKDDENEDILRVIQQTNVIIETELNKGNGVLVHCQAGQSRSCAVVAGYIMYKERIGLDEAMSMIIDVRPIVGPNLGFMGQLKGYQNSIL